MSDFLMEPDANIQPPSIICERFSLVMSRTLSNLDSPDQDDVFLHFASFQMDAR